MCFFVLISLPIAVERRIGKRLDKIMPNTTTKRIINLNY